MCTDGLFLRLSAQDSRDTSDSMNKTILSWIAWACVLGLAGGVQAESKLNKSSKPAVGRIGFISSGDKKITVKPKGGGDSLGFMIAADTKITINGEAKTYEDLKKDWKVTVEPKADDPSTAASVAVTRGKAGEGPEEKTGEEASKE